MVDGELTAFADAKLHVLSTTLKYGVGVFEGIRAYWDDESRQLYGFRIPDHLARLASSAKIAAIELPSDLSEYEKQLNALVRANDLRQNLHIRIQVFVNSIDGLPHDSGPTLTAMATMPMEGYFDAPSLDVSVSSWVRISDRSLPPRAKAIGNYQNSRLAMTEARANGYTGAIQLTETGYVSEGPGYNVFIVRGGQVCTPRATDGILEGITRDSILQLAAEELGRPVIERAIDRTELYVADEIFVCGTAAQVTPVVSVDRKPVGNGEPGAVTQAIQGIYQDATHGRLLSRRNWISAFYTPEPQMSSIGTSEAVMAGDQGSSSPSLLNPHRPRP